MNIKTNLLQDYVDFVESSLRKHAKSYDNITMKKNTYFETIVVLFVIILSLFLFFFHLNT